jgi:hypothetical protein
VDVLAVTITPEGGEEQIVEGIRMIGTRFVPFREIDGEIPSVIIRKEE